MLKVTKDSITKVVTRGAYESFYKPLGFNIVDEKKTIMAVEEPKKVEEPKMVDEPKKVEEEEDKVDENVKPSFKRK
jgi:hypothetical protein